MGLGSIESARLRWESHPNHLQDDSVLYRAVILWMRTVAIMPAHRWHREKLKTAAARRKGATAVLGPCQPELVHVRAPSRDVSFGQVLIECLGKRHADRSGFVARFAVADKHLVHVQHPSTVA